MTNNGNRYIVTMIDYFSKWPEAAALPNKTARSVAQFIFTTICRYSRQTQCMNVSVVPFACYTLALLLTWKVLLLYRFGCAKVMISDQGREFVNSLNEEFMAIAGWCSNEVSYFMHVHSLYLTCKY